MNGATSRVTVVVITVKVVTVYVNLALDLQEGPLICEFPKMRRPNTVGMLARKGLCVKPRLDFSRARCGSSRSSANSWMREYSYPNRQRAGLHSSCNGALRHKPGAPST